MVELNIKINIPRHEVLKLANSLKQDLYEKIGSKVKINVEKKCSILFNKRFNDNEERIKALENEL